MLGVFHGLAAGFGGLVGESTFFHQGDGAAGAYTETDGFRYGSDWEYVPFPGTEGTYAMNMDAVIASEATENEEVVETFLRCVGSADGQRRFNQKKGSIPPRTDVSMGQFTEFLKEQHLAFRSSR
ncbi:MAG: extracellular solute-binding protein, partial [Halapricum sp.]